MSYSEKIAKVQQSILVYCKERITQNWGDNFNQWVQHTAVMEFGREYREKIKEEFSSCMSYDIYGLLWLAGNSVVFAIHTFISYKKDATLEEVLAFTEKYICEQLDNIDNWC